MRIALVTDKFATGGGLEHIYQLCQGMPDVEFGVFGRDGNAKDRFALMENVTVFSNGYSGNIIDRYNPEIIHYHHLKPIVALRAATRRTLFTVHGVHLHKYEFQSGFKSKLQRFARLSLERYLYKRIDTLITVSKDDAKFLETQHRLISTTIYNGIRYQPIEQVTDDKVFLRVKLGLPLDKKLYLTVARFDFPKGYDVLVRAIAVLKGNGSIGNKLFLFAGDGDDLSAMMQLATVLNVQEHILFLGRRTDVYELMKAADVFVLPSRWEGLPITLIESLIAKLPVIASDTYGIATVHREIKSNIYLFKNESSFELAGLLSNDYCYHGCDMGIFGLDRMISAIRKVYFEN